MRQLSVWALFAALTLFVSIVVAQSNSNSNSISLSLTTASTTITTSTTSNGRVTQFTTAVPTTFNVTLTPTPTSSANSSDSSASATPTPEPIALDTRLDPAFGVLGVILILTGLPSAFWGHKNRWTSFFLIGFYTLSLVCFVLILRFGVLRAINPPSKTVRGMFVLACGIAGIAGGGIAIFFWKVARYGIGGWGGFALALWIQCFHNGGLIKPVGFRWIFYVGCAVVGFVLCTIPRIHYHVLLISTAIVGSTALILGVDCFTTANLKEFYVWNIGFNSLFTKFTSNGIQFPVSQTMQIELGLIGAIALMGIAVQLRIYKVLRRKLDEISEEQKRRDEEADVRAVGDFAHVLRDREQWEKEHGKYAGRESGSSMPLMKDHDGSTSPRSDSTHVADARPRHPSGVSDFMAAPMPDDELKRANRGLQSPGALPALDLGLGIKDDVPDDFMAPDEKPQTQTSSRSEDQKKKDELLAEINTIRRSIDALKTGSPVPSSPAGSRRPSLTSRRTLSIDATSALLPTPSHLRPPRERDPRARIHSMDLMGNAALGESIGRPTSAPLRDVDWDQYIQERKLLQPPQGVTPPIATTPIAPQTSSRIQMPAAVAEALQQRKKRESALGLEHGSSSEDIPLGQIERDRHRRTRTSSAGGNIPVTILPPKKVIAAPIPQRPAPTRTKTFEELNERHREKMRDMQQPLTTAVSEQAQLEAAKQRWERSKALEREAVTRRQAEQAAMLEKRKKSEDDQDRRGNPQGGRHSRSLSADKLGGSSSKRLSTMKVEDWQRFQQETDASRGRTRDSVPFPGQNKPRRRSRDMLGS